MSAAELMRSSLDNFACCLGWAILEVRSAKVACTMRGRVIER
jgi:hypothetical protein